MLLLLLLFPGDSESLCSATVKMRRSRSTALESVAGLTDQGCTLRPASAPGWRELKLKLGLSPSNSCLHHSPWHDLDAGLRRRTKQLTNNFLQMSHR